MTDRELMQMAMDGIVLARIQATKQSRDEILNEIAEALRARLAQPEPEPVAWHEPGAYGNVTVHKAWARENGWLPLYAAPPRGTAEPMQREWVGLTDEDWHEFMRDFLPDNRYGHTRMRAVWEFSQSKLKEKNS